MLLIIFKNLWMRYEFYLRENHKVKHFMWIMSTPPLGWGGTPRFTVVSHHSNVCRRLSMSVPDFVYGILLIFSTMAFKFTDMVTMEKILHWLMFRDYGSLFKVTGGHYVSKLTLFTCYFLQFFTNGLQILRYGDHGQDLELINFPWLWLNFQGHRGYYVSKLTLFTHYFLQFFVNAFKFSDMVTIDTTLN